MEADKTEMFGMAAVHCIGWRENTIVCTPPPEWSDDGTGVTSGRILNLTSNRHIAAVKGS